MLRKLFCHLNPLCWSRTIHRSLFRPLDLKRSFGLPTRKHIYDLRQKACKLTQKGLFRRNVFISTISYQRKIQHKVKLGVGNMAKYINILMIKS